MAVSTRFNWRDQSQYSLPVTYYVNFLSLQKKHVKLKMTLHKNSSSYLFLTKDQQKCMERLDKVLLDSKKTHQVTILQAPAGTGLKPINKNILAIANFFCVFR